MSYIVQRLEAAQLDRDNCPYMDSEIRVRVGLAREAAAEIKRLLAENESLKHRLPCYGESP